jgi:iron complex transport system ATP-binding protein
MHALSVHDITFSYDATPPVLRSVTLHVVNGEFLTIVGPNGSGKSTLLRLLDRILSPQSGDVRLHDRDLVSFSRQEIARRVAFVPQDTGMLFPFTVQQVVLMGRSPHSKGAVFENADDRRIAAEAMALMDIGHLEHQPVTALSGGERQRAFIARALAQRPEILLLDEPNAHLDIAHQLDVFSILRKLNRDQGLTVVSVSHDLNLAAAFSDRVAMLRGGTIAALGTPEAVLTEAHIKEVFGTDVVVDLHPRDGTTRVSLITSPLPIEPLHGHLRTS